MILVIPIFLFLLFSKKESRLDLFSTFSSLIFYSTSMSAMFSNLNFMCRGIFFMYNVGQSFIFKKKLVRVQVWGMHIKGFYELHSD